MTLPKPMAAMAAALCLLLVAATAASAAPGDFDRSFADKGRLRLAPLEPAYRFESAVDLAAGPNGETYVLRRAVHCQETPCGADLLVSRYRPDGSLDTAFGEDGTARALGTAAAYRFASLTVDAQGRPLVSVAEERIFVVRLGRNGSVERTFATEASALCGCFVSTAEIGFAADGDLVVFGRAEEWFGPDGPPEDRRGWAVFLVGRFSAEGQVDTGFADGGQGLIAVRGEVNSVAVQADGGMLLGGANEGSAFVRRVGSDGRLDESFGSGFGKALVNRGAAETTPYAILPKANGGAFAFVSNLFSVSSPRSFVAALDPQGRLVSRFGRRGLKHLPISVFRGVQDPQGRMFVEGQSQEGESIVMRLLANGSPDRTFGGGRPIRLESEYQALAMGRGSRPLLLDPGNRSFRSYSPPKPVVLRFRGGSSKVRCAGRRATIVGTRRGERLKGTEGPDVIAALGGADRVLGLGGADLICGGPGADKLIGGPGRDRLHP